MNWLNRIMHILFLLAIVAFSVNYYIEVTTLPLYEEREVVQAVFWLLMIFIGLELCHHFLKLPSAKLKGQTGKVKGSQSRLPWRLGHLLKDKKLLLFIMTVAYLPSIMTIGFFTSTFVYMVVLSYALGSRSIKELFVVHAAVLTVLFLFFVKLLEINLPKGILF